MPEPEIFFEPEQATPMLSELDVLPTQELQVESAAPEVSEAEALKLDNERLHKQVSDNKRKVSVLYEENVRKLQEKEAVIEQLKSKLSGNYDDVATIADIKTVGEISRVEQEHQAIQQDTSVYENQVAILQAFPEYDSMIEDIAIYAKSALGLNDSQVEAFRNNPYAENVSDINNVVSKMEIWKLKQENASILELLQANDQVNSNINKSLLSRTLTNSGSSTPRQKVAINASDIVNLSDDAIKQYLGIQ